MATKIRLQRRGRRHRPFYAIVVVDSRKKRDGAFVEKLGWLDPLTDPETVKLDLERVEHWLAQGAEMSERVRHLVKAVREGRVRTPEDAGAEAAAG